MAKVNNSAKERAYSVALFVASQTTVDSRVITASKKLAKNVQHNVLLMI
ncbi:hypothetical protein G9394_10215 [Proteus vulgaris]|nr:hypothetical protein G9394_10215 [Proteus vulgaris]